MKNEKITHIWIMKWLFKSRLYHLNYHYLDFFFNLNKFILYDKF